MSKSQEMIEAYKELDRRLRNNGPWHPTEAEEAVTIHITNVVIPDEIEFWESEEAKCE